MNNKLVAVLCAACLPLMLIMTGEWFVGLQSRESALSAKANVSKVAVTTEMPSIDLTGEPEESYEQLVERPLFIKGRRPVNEPTPEESQSVLMQANFDWQLDGVYTTPNGEYALLGRQKVRMPKDNYRKIKVGDHLEGWELSEITHEKVVFSLGAEKKLLVLKKPKPKTQQASENKTTNSKPVEPNPAVTPPTQIIPAIPQILPDSEIIDGNTELPPENGFND